jgi:uncharacterized membrane protein SirB2
MYAFLKTLHVSCVAATITGFVLRGYWIQSGSTMLQYRSVRIVPHVVDTLLLASGIALIVELNVDVMQQNWLLAKIAGIIAYILLGFVTMRLGRTPQARMLAYAAALAVFAYAAGTAVAKSASSWLAYLIR